MKSNVVSNFAFIIITYWSAQLQLADGQTGVSVLCPPILKELAESTKCEAIKCVSTLRQRDCPPGSVLEDNVTVCKCCPGCVRINRGNEYNKFECTPGLDDHEDYNMTCTDRICEVVLECPRGLTCRPEDPEVPTSTPKCLLPLPYLADPPPADCRKLCWIKQALAKAFNWDWRYNSACTPDGYYKPIQCKGDGYAGDCFCVDQCGKRIFGRARYASAGNQTCECSRRVHTLRTQNDRIATFHCTEDGNYEALQCDTDSSLCYCVDPKTGKLTGEVLPEHQWKNLPCYDAKAVNFDEGGRYLRRCESEWAAAQKIAKEAQIHGLTFDKPSKTLVCDYDGGFGPKFIDVADNRDFCSRKDGTIIGAYFRPLNDVVPMDCHCARDIMYYATNKIPFTRNCDTRLTAGSYWASYINGVNASCVDDDGYNFGIQPPSAYACCLESVRDSFGEYQNTCPQEHQAECAKYPRCATYELIRKPYITSG